MKRLKPLIMKTYGKERRKLPAWISPENRKKDFDSTRSTDSDSEPVCETAEPKTKRERKMSVCHRRAGRLVKSKAKLCLTEKSSDEEFRALFCHQPAQQSKTTRVRKTRSVAAARPAKRETMSILDTSSNAENINRPSSPCPQQSMTTSGHLPSAGRFVTKRRRAAAATKPKLSKAPFTTLNSSDDFTSGAFGSSRILRSAKRRVPSAFALSSAENSVNAPRAASFATNPLQEISLSELTNNSLGPCPRKPIFCSTPSAGSLRKRLCLMPLSNHDHSTSPPSMSLSCVGVLSTFQEDVASPGQPVTAPPAGLQSKEETQSSLGEHESDLHHCEEPSADLFMEPKSTGTTNSCGEEAKSQSDGIKIKNVRELPSLCLLSTGDSESHFVSAAGELEWLIDALKEKCLTEHCTVQLERLDNLTVSQLSSQTTTISSSCLGLSSSMNSRQTNEYPLSVYICPTTDCSQFSELHLSTTDSKTSDYLQSMASVESSEHAALVTGSQSRNKQGSMAQSESVLFVDSTHHEDSTVEFIPGTQLPSSSHLQTLFAVAVKERCFRKKCNVKLKQMSLSQQMSGADKSENDHIHNIEVPADLTCSGEIERVMVSINNSSPVSQSYDLETERKVSVLAKLLKEKCLTNKVIVELKRMTLSQLKEIVQNSDAKPIKLKSPADVSGLACDDQIKRRQQSESDTNRCDEETSTMKVRGFNTSGDKSTSHDEEVAKTASSITHNRRKTFRAPKEKKGRRSKSTDQPGTTRKACVSGLSVSRWKNKGSASSTHMFRTRTGGNKALDSSISELISTQHKQPQEWLGTTENFSTPVKASQLNLSSLLADLTPNTHTWSRLKAALSVHRKNMVLLTPSSSRLSGSPGRALLSDISQDLFATPFQKPLVKHLRSQQLSHDSPFVCEDADLSDAEKVYAECGQQRPLSWEKCILPQRMKQCVKIGEGTFGEVFSTTNASGDAVALKIIPIEGSEKVNGEDQKTFGEILHEIIISKELSSLKEKQQNKTDGFIGLNDLHCVQGYYPPDFLKAWDAFDQRRGSENDRPDFFDKDQLFIILEFEFGGNDLENSNGKLTSLVAKSILHQVTAALAVAEQELHFEHRDLHWGNVLVKTTKEKTGSFLLNGAAHSLETKGVLVRIIDYSLSRLEIDDLTVSCDISADEELFMGQGDYQFDIYRLMRQENGNNWSNYHPHTNVLWLHYLCSKLLSMKYRVIRGRGAKGMREELTRFYDNVLQYSSATDVLQNCPMFQ